MKKLAAILAAICLAAFAPALAAGEAAAEDRALQLGASSICFPAVVGMEDAALEPAVNAQIRQDLQVDRYLERMNALISDGQRSITVSWSGGVAGDVFSALLDAEGLINPPRNSHAWTWSNVDLRDGHEIAFAELFTEEEAAREALEALLEEAAAEGSAHLENSGWTPLPEGFVIDSTGLTLLYDVKQLSTLSGRAGAVKIGWNEIREVADWSADGIPARAGAAEMVTLTEESPGRIREMTESGQLPGIPVKIGDSVKEWTDRTHLLNDPDEYAGGRMFAPEGACFRNVYLLSDAVGSGWEDSRVQGIRMDRGCAWGLCVGETTAAEWHLLLGEPDETAAFDGEAAENWRTVPGTCDYYQYGENRLQLHYNEDGVLTSLAVSGR